MSTIRDFHVMRNSLLMDKSLRAKNTHIVKGFAPGAFYDLTYPVALVPKAVISVVDDAEETDASTNASGNVLTNDSVSEGSLSVVRVARSSANLGVAVAGSNGGLFTIGSDGAWTFDPSGDFDSLTGDQTATSSVTYHVSDGVAEDEGTLTVMVGVPTAVELEFVGSATAQGLNAPFTLTLPTGILPGDLVLVYAGCGYGSDINRVTSPDGFTTIARPVISSGTWRTYNYLGYKIMGAVPDTELTIAGSGSAGYPTLAIAYVWRGADPTTPLDVSAVSLLGQGPDDRLLRAGPVTPVTAGAVLLAMCSASDGDAFTLTPPTGYEHAVQRSYDPSAGYTMCVSSKLWGGGTEPQVTWNNFSLPLRSSAIPNSWNGIMLALRPAS